MKAIFYLAVCGALLAGSAIAQHRGGGGGGGGGGFHGSTGGGISHGGGAVMGGGYRGSTGGFSTGAYRGGYSYGGGYNRGFSYGSRGFSYGSRGYGYGYGGYYGGFYGGYYPWYGFGFGVGYSPYYYGDYGYPYSYPDTYSYPVSSSYYSTYSPQPSVNVVYPQSQPTTVYVDRSSAGQGAYDQYGQPLTTGTNGNSGSPIYLIATKDHTIQAALSYSVNGSTVEYVTMDHQQKQVALDQVDRDLSMRLNRERHVAFQLPAQQ